MSLKPFQAALHLTGRLRSPSPVRWLTYVLLLLTLWGCNLKGRQGKTYVMAYEEGIDFTQSLTRAVGDARARGLTTITLPPGTHAVSSTFLLPSDFTFLGENKTVLKAEMIRTARGGYPVTIFDSPETGVENVVIKGIVFDGNGAGMKKNLSQTEGAANTLRLRNSRNVRFINCELRNHFSNIPAPYSAANFEEVRSCVGFSVEGCNRITLTDFRLRALPNEALLFYDSKNILVEGMDSKSHRELSTHLNFLYCDTVDVKNGFFSYDRGGGSCLNIESSNVRIADNDFENGRGIDISNEAGFEDFYPENVVVTGNRLTDVKYYGIMRNRTKRALKNFTVTDNHIAINGATGSRKGVKIMAIKTDDTEGALVQNNQISFNNTRSDNDHIAFGSFGYRENGTELKENIITGADYLYWGNTLAGGKTDITISNNDCSLSGKDNAPGAIYLYNGHRGRPGGELNGLRIEHNRITGKDGTRLLAVVSRNKTKLNDLIVTNNNPGGGGTNIVLSGKALTLTGRFEVTSAAGSKAASVLLEEVELPEAVIRQIGEEVSITKRNR